VAGLLSTHCVHSSMEKPFISHKDVLELKYKFGPRNRMIRINQEYLRTLARRQFLPSLICVEVEDVFYYSFGPQDRTFPATHYSQITVEFISFPAPSKTAARRRRVDPGGFGTTQKKIKQYDIF